MLNELFDRGCELASNVMQTGMSLAGMPPNARGLDMAAGALPIQPQMIMRAEPVPVMAYTHKPLRSFG
ncbi:MAG: hypothetical protein J0L77_01345 [Alphaproteobacteria bacterium]|nr:hypothetical protein [Alphaproteobacteria bacterium]